MKRYKCTNCNHILEVEEEKDKTIFGKMLKMGGWLVAGAVVLHFLALFIMIGLIVAFDSVFDKNEVKQKKVACENCKETDFEELEE